MRARQVNEAAGSKDIARIESIIKKSKGDSSKEIMYAENMAKAITKPGKARARAEAAQQVYGELNDISDIFFNRMSELTGGVDIDATPSKVSGEKEDYSKWEPPASKRVLGGTEADPEEAPAGKGFRRHGNPYKKLGIGQYSASAVKINKGTPVHHGRSYGYGGAAIASLGKVNLMTGGSKIFNLFDTWDDGTVEVWRTDAGQFKLIYTSSNEPYRPINDTASFQNDQSGRHLFDAKMVDYTALKDMPGLIPLYGRSMTGYTYK